MSLQNGSLPSPTDGAPDRTERRRAVLATFGGSGTVADELLQYNANLFSLSEIHKRRFPLDDELCVDEWSVYAARVAAAKDVRAIYPWIPQLQFPIRRGTSELPEYHAATKHGQFIYPKEPASGLGLESPTRCQVYLHATQAGRIPVILTATRSDFVSMVQAFTMKGEPDPVPESMGAVVIGGYNNFRRVELLRQSYFDSGGTVEGWGERFTQIKQHKELYQDQFVILSPGPYSNIPASSLHFDEQEWHSLSVLIRLDHECTHYFTRRVFGSMRNNILDEIVADYCGTDQACGVYRREWALTFLGIEDHTAYRAGGRLENYRGDPSLSPPAFELLARLVRAAAANLEGFNRAVLPWRNNSGYQVATIVTLAAFTLEELAAPVAVQLLNEEFRSRITRFCCWQ